MEALTIRYTDQADSDACVLCGRSILATAGPQLFDETTGRIACRTCGTRHAPHLAALLDLAKVSERVGRVCRHTLTPPMNTLLELARAAEDYNAKATTYLPSPVAKYQSRSARRPTPAQMAATRRKMGSQ
jgi:hypothetical protein